MSRVELEKKCYEIILLDMEYIGVHPQEVLGELATATTEELKKFLENANS